MPYRWIRNRSTTLYYPVTEAHCIFNDQEGSVHQETITELANTRTISVLKRDLNRLVWRRSITRFMHNCSIISQKKNHRAPIVLCSAIHVLHLIHITACYKIFRVSSDKAHNGKREKRSGRTRHNGVLCSQTPTHTSLHSASKNTFPLPHNTGADYTSGT